MAIKTVASLKSFFEQGDKPTEAQFGDLIDSTYSGEIGAAIVSAVSAGNTGLINVTNASAVTFNATATAGLAVLSANTPASARTVLSAASAGDAVFQIGTVGSVRTFIGAASTSAATTTSAGIIEIATTAEVTAGTDTERAVTPAALRAPGGGRVVQSVDTQTGAVATGTTTMPADDTIPQITEGTEFMTLAITPTNASNILEIEVVANLAFSAGAPFMTAALFQDSTADALAATTQVLTGADEPKTYCFRHRMTAGTTSATTFRVRGGSPVAGTTTFNGAAGARLLGGVIASSITITEIAA